MENTPKRHLLILAILAFVVGLFMITVAPVLIQTSMERVIGALVEVSKEKPAYSSGILLFSFAYPLYRGLIFIGGIMLMLFAVPISRGESWTFPPALLAAAFPSAGGMFMFLPYVSFVDGFPIPMIISFVGLAFFWSFILLRNVDRWLKWSQFFALTMSGMLTTHAFVVGIGNMRMLLTRPLKPLYSGLEWWILSWSNPVQWLCVILFFVAIYMLAAKKKAGWWLAVIAGTSLLVIDAPTQVIRTMLTDSTSLDYLYGSLLCIALLLVLLYPKSRAALVGEAMAETTVGEVQLAAAAD